MLNKNIALVYGDMHLCSSNYGGHIDYAGESLENFQKINMVAEEEDCGVIIGAGDLAQHTFNKLEYKLAVEKELEDRNKLTDNNYFELKGNHDSMTSGMSEWEFYKAKGMLRNEPYVDVGCARIHMVNFGEEARDLDIDTTKKNIVVAHNYFKYKSTVFPNYGKAIELDFKESWQYVDLILCGHIHDRLECVGKICGKDIPVIYMGSPNRQAYKKSGMDESGLFIILDCSGDDVKLVQYEFALRPLEDTFMIVKAQKENPESLVGVPDEEYNNYGTDSTYMKIEEHKIDVSDIIEDIAKSDITMGDPEKVIDTLSCYSPEARDLAKKLYREALNK